LEFEIRRELYYWFLKELDLYRPYVWEFSRLNISNNVVSKRKLRELVEKEYVKGWDDPRLLTLIGMRRRGYPAISINEFCDILSVTRSGNENIISFGYLEFVVRKELDVSAKRTLAVIDPVLVTLTNLADDFVKEI
jgi:glutaminyl-tRNA synthetase